MARDPKAVVEVTAESKTLGARLREARAKFTKFGGELKKEVFGKELVKGGFFGKAGAQMVGSLGASALSAVGGMLVSQGRDVLEFNDALKRLEITASKTPEEMAAFAASIRKTSGDVGIGAKDILDGAQAYVALTGDMDGAAKSATTWARVAQATNSAVSDISKTAAALKQQMNINPEDMEKTFSALAAQGKAGAIELKDLATQLSSIAPQWAEFAGGKGVQGVKEMGAALQIVKRGFGGDAGETITGLQSLLNAYVKNAARLSKGGVKVFDKDPKTGLKSLRSVLDITNDLANSKLAKDPTKLEKALGRVEAYRAYLQLKDNRAELERMIEVAGDAGLIQRDLDKYTQSSAGRAKVAWQKAKNEIAEAFTPERIEQFTQLIITASKAAATLAGWISTALKGVENVGTGLAMLLGYETDEDKVTKTTARQYRTRWDLAKQVLKKNGDAEGLSDEELTEKAQRLVGTEDAMAKRLMGGGRLGDSDTVPAQYKTVQVKGKDGKMHEEREMVSMERKGYNVAEMDALANYLDKSDLTNKQDLQLILRKMIADQVAAQDRFLEKFGEKASNTMFSIGPDPIMTATRTAPQSARRPSE